MPNPALTALTNQTGPYQTPTALTYRNRPCHTAPQTAIPNRSMPRQTLPNLDRLALTDLTLPHQPRPP